MTREQRLLEVRKALAMDERLAGLLIEVAQDWANDALRRQYQTNDAATLIRQAGLAEGVEKFIHTLTKDPTAAS